MAHHQPSNTAAPLSELVLSSTASASPLPTLSLHHPLTGALVYSFRAPVANSNIATTGGAPGSARSKGKDAQDEGQSLDGRRTLALVEGANGMGGFIAGLGGKDGRAGLNVWNFTRETTQHRLIPPVRLSTMTVSRDGLYMAGGTPDGRVFLWEVSSGNLLVTVDAHYRAVSALEFSDDGAALVSASEDAGVCVWAIGRLLAATPMNPPAPFATLSDHTLAVTDVRVGLGTFPHCRVMTASMDSTVKIWDISTSPASLLSTFAFPHPVTHIAWDSLERFFFAAGPSSSPSSSTSAASSSSAPTDPAAAAAAPCGSRVVRVNLYRKRRDEFGIEVAEPVGGGGRGEVERVAAGAESGREGEVYEIADTITALHLSPYSPTLLVGTSTTQTHVLSLPSLLPSRILVPPPSSTSPGPITFLSTLLRPSELGASSSGSSSSAAAAGATDLPQRAIMPQGMGRTVVPPSERERGGPNARTVDVRLGAARDVADLLSPAAGLSPFALSLAGVGAGAGAGVGVGAGAGADALDRERRRAGELEREVEALKRQLGRAVGQSERVWSRAVEGALNGRGGGEAR